MPIASGRAILAFSRGRRDQLLSAKLQGFTPKTAGIFGHPLSRYPGNVSAVLLLAPFEDGMALLRVAEQRGLEGVVIKRLGVPDRSGGCRDWHKSRRPGAMSAV